MWGASIVGFGNYSYRYDSGHEGTSAQVGLAPRKSHLVLPDRRLRGPPQEAPGEARAAQDGA